MATPLVLEPRPPQAEGAQIPSALTPEERAHAASILDASPILAPIPPKAVQRVLVASVVRKPPVVLKAFLASVAAQVVERAELSYAWVTDFAASDAYAAESLKVLSEFCSATPRATFAQHHSNLGTDYGDGPTTRNWSSPAFARMGALKNALIQKALTEGFDALWLVDADVLCDHWTLQSLRDCERPIVAGVYWTQWQRPLPGDAAVVHAGPQVWLRHPYRLDGHGYTEAEFRAALVARRLLRVWGLGACTLFQRPVLEKGVSFLPVPEGLPLGPMADGEDRHLSERARRLHLPLYADAWPDIWHAYHPAEYADIPKWQRRLSEPRPVKPAFGDLVSVRLQNLEQPEVAPQWVRGRLGQLGVVPELEEAAAALAVRDERVVKVHFPLSYPLEPYRLRSFLFHVKLLDAKQYCQPPVVGRELLVGAKTNAIIDSTTLAPAQLEEALTEATAL